MTDGEIVVTIMLAASLCLVLGGVIISWMIYRSNKYTRQLKNADIFVSESRID